MPDIGTIAGAVTSLKAAGDIAKALVGLRDGAAFQNKLIELQAAIMSAQSSALAAQSDQFTLLERVRELEAQVTKMKAWSTEKKRYNLTEIAPGVLTYIPKQSMKPSEPLHAICANCYQQERKSILQYEGNFYGSAKFVCHSCSSEISARINQPLFPFKNIVDTGRY